MDWVAIFGAGQALLLALYFWQQRRHRGFKLFSATLLLAAMGISQSVLFGSREILNYPHLARIGFPLASFLGPALFWGLMYMFRETLVKKHWVLLSLAYPIGLIIYLTPFFLESAEYKIAYLKADFMQIHFDCVVINHLTLIQNTFFLTAAWLLLRRKIGATVGISFFELFRIRLVQATPVFAAMHLLTFVLALIDPSRINTNWFGALFAAFIIALSYYLLFYTLSPADSPNPTAPMPSENEAEKYAKHSLPEELVNEKGALIERHFADTRCYLDPDFSFADLEPVTELSSHSNSQVVNRYFGHNFGELLTKYRVAAVQERLLDPEYSEWPILRVAFESGFNSKSSFNWAFKRFAGLTPSAWRSAQSAGASKRSPTPLGRSPDP